MNNITWSRFQDQTGRFKWSLVLLSILLIALVYREQFLDILGIAIGGIDRGYVLLVPPVAAYLMAIRWSRMRRNRKSNQGGWLGFLLVASSFLFAWIGHDRDLLAVWHLAPFIAFVGVFIAALGVRSILVLAPGFVILPFTVPLPGMIRQKLAQPLQAMATEVTSWVLNLLGVDAMRVGNLLEINGVQVAVGEACNGMRLILPLAIVMYAFVFSLPLRAGTRTLLLALCLPVAMACNVIRLVPTALAYGYMPDHASAVHEIGGWIMIPLAIGMLVGLLRLMAWADLSVSRFRLVTA